MSRNLTKTQRQVLKIKPGTHICVFHVYGEFNHPTEFGMAHVQVKENYNLETLEIIDIKIPKKKNRKAVLEKILSYFDNADVLTGYKSDVLMGYNTGLSLTHMDFMARELGKEFDRRIDGDILNFCRDFIDKTEVESFHLKNVAAKLLNTPVCKLNNMNNQISTEIMLLEILLKKYKNYIPPIASQTKLLSATLTYNVKTKSGKKILLTLEKCKPGDVYYDGDLHEWIVKEQAKDKLFANEAIRQFKLMYQTPMGCSSEDEVIQQWYEFTESVETKSPKRKAKKA